MIKQNVIKNVSQDTRVKNYDSCKKCERWRFFVETKQRQHTRDSFNHYLYLLVTCTDALYYARVTNSSYFPFYQIRLNLWLSGIICLILL